MKIFLLLFSVAIVLYADNLSQRIHLKSDQESHGGYFIKLGAFSNAENARKVSLSTDFPVDIVYLKRYYSLIGHRYDTKQEAQKALKSLKKRFSDAYIIKLYVDPEQSKKQIPQHHKAKNNTIRIFTQAVEYYKKKQYEEALVLFDRELIENPQNQNAKLYYAKTLYQLGLFKEAAGNFHQLEKELLQKMQQKQIHYYLKMIAEKEQKNFFSATLSYGAGYDDNINLNTDTTTTRYGPFTLQNDTNKTKSTYGILSLELSHRYKSKAFDLLTTLYSYNELAHSAKGNDLNYFDLSTAVMKKYKKFSFILPVGYSRIYLDSKLIGFNYYTHPTLIYQMTRHFTTTLHTNFTDNHTKFAINRDYTLLGSGLGIRYQSKKVTGAVDVNLENFSKKDEGRYDISKNVEHYTLYGEYQFYQSLYFGANAAYECHHFTDLDTVMGYKRKDNRRLYGVWITKTIDKKTSLKAKYLHTNNGSNVNVYSYSKNNYTLQYKHIF